MFAAPVKLVESDVTNVPNYGTGVAPYFLSLGLYVGGIMAANILPLARRKDAKNGTSHFVNKLFLFYALGIIQTIIVDLVVLYGFKLQVVSEPRFYLYSLLVSLTFQTIVATLASVFGMIGKFIAITLLILQLASCGGTFPWQLNSPFMQGLGKILPMTYSVQGFQDIISIGDWSFLGKQVLILLGYAVVVAAVKWVVTVARNNQSAANAGGASAH
jgi:putative membrane protein